MNEILLQDPYNIPKICNQLEIHTNYIPEAHIATAPLLLWSYIQ